MKFSTVALSFLAIGVATVAAASEQQEASPAARDFERKMEVRDPRKHSKRRNQQLITDAMFTWYGGGQLSAPACGGAAPSKYDHVVAVKEGGMFKCHDTVHLHYNGKMVSATVRDYCGSCAPHHLDLTQGTFESLASLGVGEIHGAHVRLIPHN